jgi:hypothetical protein
MLYIVGKFDLRENFGHRWFWSYTSGIFVSGQFVQTPLGCEEFEFLNKPSYE